MTQDEKKILARILEKHSKPTFSYQCSFFNWLNFSLTIK